MEQKIEFVCKDTGIRLRGRFIKPESFNYPSPVVIMLTGDGPKGSKSLSWVNVPPKLLEHNISSFLFDFAGLGYSEGERKKLTLSVGISNFKSAFEVVLNESWIDKNRIGIFASSFGANVALLLPELMNRVKLIGLKSPSCFLPDAYINEIGNDEFDKWRQEGFCEKNGYNFEVVTDCFNYNTYKEVKKINTPCLITHGSKDEIVPINQSKFLYECLSGNKKLKIFKNVGHGYSEEGAWDRMASIFVDWFSDNL